MVTRNAQNVITEPLLQANQFPPLPHSTAVNTIPQTMFSFFWNIYLGQSPRTEISGSKVWTYYQAVFCFVPPPPSQAYAYLTATLSETVVFSPHYRSRISAQKLHVTNVYNLASLDIHILSCYYDCCVTMLITERIFIFVFNTFVIVGKICQQNFINYDLKCNYLLSSNRFIILFQSK